MTRLPSNERKKQIAEAALRILAHQGSRNLTAKALGETVGITDGAIFRHFRDKDEIIAAALDVFEEAIGVFSYDTSQPPLETLEQFFIYHILRVRDHPEILKLAFNDRLETVAGDEGAKRIQKKLRASTALVRRCIGSAKKRGELPKDVDTDVVTWMIIGVLRGTALASSGAMASRPEVVWQRLRTALFNKA